MSSSKSKHTSTKPVPADSVAAGSETAAKSVKVSSGPLPGTPEYVQAQMTLKGITSSPVKLMSELGQKRPAAETTVTIYVVILWDNSGANNHLPTAIFFKGDMFCVKDQIKLSNTAESVVNGVTIPVVLHGLSAKFISNALMRAVTASAPPECRLFANFLKEQCEQCWMVYAVPPEDNIEMLHMAAMVDTRVDLHEYALAWKRALLGKPLHYDTVNIVNYFVSDEEVPFLATIHATKDANFGRRKF